MTVEQIVAEANLELSKIKNFINDMTIETASDLLKAEKFLSANLGESEKIAKAKKAIELLNSFVELKQSIEKLVKDKESEIKEKALAEYLENGTISDELLTQKKTTLVELKNPEEVFDNPKFPEPLRWKAFDRPKVNKKWFSANWDTLQNFLGDDVEIESKDKWTIAFKPGARK